MRRLTFLFVPAMAILAGCPMWHDDQYFYDYDDDFDDDDCYDGRCTPPLPPPDNTCSSQTDCFVGESCTATGVCSSDSCVYTGCYGDAECVIREGRAVCVEGEVGECRNSGECPVPGSQCINNSCVPPEQQCADSTQCRSDQRCVNGACTNQCASDSDCPIGYGCDEARNVCTENPEPCSDTDPCSDGATCVGDRCVQPCDDDDQCPADLVCRYGGCVVDPTPDFLCAVTGELGDGTPGKCNEGSICLRGSCYIACDASDDQSCRAADEFNQCKPVSTGGATYHVCGSDENLGSECDVAQGNPCDETSQICVDGYCR